MKMQSGENEEKFRPFRPHCLGFKNLFYNKTAVDKIIICTHLKEKKVKIFLGFMQTQELKYLVNLESLIQEADPSVLNSVQV